jgi:uncharacterized protein YjbI with pentapeptide repeats
MPSKRSSHLPDAPDLPEEERLSIISDLQIIENSSFENSLATNFKLIGLQSAHIKLRECVWREVELLESELSFVEITDVMLQTCDFANSRWDWFAANRVHFKSCRLLGFKAIDSEIVSARFDDCLMELSQFRFAKMPGAYFDHCDLRHADFSGADLTNATFADCDLSDAAFSQAKCRGVDFRSSKLDRLTVGPAELSGVIIDPVQAAELVKVFGVTVLNTYDALPTR